MDNIRIFLRGLSSCLAAAKMYKKEHPQVKIVMDETFAGLQGILGDREELVIGIVEGELIYDQEILFDLNTMLELIVVYATKKEIEKIYFYKGVKREELENFVYFLLLKEKEMVGDAQNHLAMAGITNIKVSRLTTALETKKEKTTTQVDYYDTAGKELFALFPRVVEGGSAAKNIHMEIRLIIFNMMEHLLEGHQKYLAWEANSTSHPVIAHSMHVGMLAMNVASRMGFIQEHVLEMGVASLLHDIGSFALSQLGEDSNKNGETKASFLGAEILLRLESELGVLPAVVAFEHSLWHDLAMEKTLRRTCPQQVTSLLVAICSYYDDLFQGMIRQASYSPLEVYQHMAQKEPGFFHPQLLEKFFKIIGIWPTSSIVALSDGRTGIVRRQDEEDMFSPQVAIFSSSGEQEDVLVLRKTEPKIRIVKALHPLKEGQPYQKFR